MEIVGMEMARRRTKHLFWAMVRLVSTYHVSSRLPAWLAQPTRHPANSASSLLHASATAS